MQVDRAWRLLCYFNLYVNLWPLWDSWKLFTLISPDPTFFPKWKVGVNLYVNLWSLWDSWKLCTLISPDPTFFFKWEVGVNVIDMPPDPESRSRVINYFLFALSLTLERLVRQLLNFNTSERNDTAPWRTTSLLTTVEVLPVFHSYSILKKLFSLVFYSIDYIVESGLWPHCLFIQVRIKLVSENDTSTMLRKLYVHFLNLNRENLNKQVFSNRNVIFTALFLACRLMT